MKKEIKNVVLVSELKEFVTDKGEKKEYTQYYLETNYNGRKFYFKIEIPDKRILEQFID